MAELATKRNVDPASRVVSFASRSVGAMERSRPVRLRFGSFELDPKSGELAGPGATVVLQWQPLQLLLMLIGRAGEMVTRDEIQQRIWDDDVVVDFNHGINQLARKLRRVLGDSAGSPHYIETLARRGYRLKVPVAVVEKAQAAMLADDLQFPAGKLPAHRNGRGAGEPAAPGPGPSMRLREPADAAEQHPMSRRVHCRLRSSRNAQAHRERLTPLIQTLSADMLQQCVRAATPAERLQALREVLALVAQLAEDTPV